MKWYIAFILICVSIIGIGIAEDVANNPVRGCYQFETGTKYPGYHCDFKDVYVLWHTH